MTPTYTARTSLSVLLAICMMIAANTGSVNAQTPKGGKLPPPPPPTDPLDRIESALDKLDKRLSAVEDDVKTLKADVATLKGDKAKTDKKTKDLDTRVTKVESRVTTLEKRPPLKITEYRTVYKSEPPTYIYVREPGILKRQVFTYVTDKLHVYVDTSSTWVLVTK